MYTLIVVLFIISLVGYIILQVKEAGKREQRLMDCMSENAKLNAIIKELSTPVTDRDVTDKLRDGEF